MCGLAGFLSPPAREEEMRDALYGMTIALRHRGPDDDGVWIDAQLGIGLGHRRLSIIDLSAEGHQPMLSGSGRYVLVYNGEIYNHRELRTELERAGHGWRGHSDTEVLLAAVEEWGVERTLPRLNGMFAVALWDRQERLLHLARDPLGEKPLYYGWCGDTLLFGSELKALRAHPRFAAEIDPTALRLFMRYGYIPTPYSIYRGIQKLPPGTRITVRPGEVGVLPQPSVYWSAWAAAQTGVRERSEASEAELVSELDTLLRDAVRLRMEADVPLGAFLSGGIDSSTVVALMQAQSSRPVRTFSIGVAEGAYNEAEHARLVAAHLGTEHTELYVTPRQALDVVPRLPSLYDEPFADSSQIPTFLVAQLARRDVTVSLSGDGGDELFGGYNRHAWGEALWRRMRHVPLVVRRAAAASLSTLSPAAWERVIGTLEPMLPRRLVHRNVGEKLQKLARAITASDHGEIYSELVSHWPAAVVLGGREPNGSGSGIGELPNLSEQMMYLDTIRYLPDDILVKVDRATMGVSLEGRIPLLDTRVVEFAWRLPLHMKIRDGRGKHLLRQVLYRYVPQELVDRPKAGFAVPVDQWLRRELRDWAEELLDETRLRQDGLLAASLIRHRWAEHISGRRNWQHHLWDVLMFQSWREHMARDPADTAAALA